MKSPARIVGRAAVGSILGLLLAATATSAASAATSPSPAPSGAPQAITFGIRPTGSVDDPRSSFRFRLDPGSSIRDTVSVFNYSTDPLTLKLYAADALTNDSGDVTLLPRAAESEIARWVTFSGPKNSGMVVPARTRVDVPFTLRVPAGATPGDHVGGLAVLLPATTTDATGSAVAVDSSVAVPLSVRVGGDSRARVEIQQLSARYEGDLRFWAPGSVVTTYRVVNTGTISQSIAQTLSLAGLVGDARVVDAPPIEALLPGDAVDVELAVPDAWPLLRYTATVVVVPSAAAGDPLAELATSSVDLWAVPWPQLALLALVAGLVALWPLTRRRGARNVPVGGKHAVPDLVESA